MLSEISYIIKWFLAMVLVTISVLPMTVILFQRFKDKGYIAAKTMGLLLCGGLMWALSALHLVKFTYTASYLCIIVILAVSVIFFLYQIRSQSLSVSGYFKTFPVKRFMITALVYELAFFAIFCYFSYLRGNTAGLYGIEKFMDYGFVKAISRSPYMPAPDIWYSGETINYYYVGQFITAYLIKISQTNVAFGYSLMLTMIPSLGFLLSFSIVFNLLSLRTTDKPRFMTAISAIGGVIAGLANTVAANFHYVLYGLFKILGKADGSPYYYWDSTRFIGHNPDMPDKTIHEFPAYSFILGDLHAHVINYMFVLTLMFVLIAWFLQKRELIEAESTNASDATEKSKKSILLSYLKEALSPELILIAVMLGLFHGINFWDFPIYYIVTGAVVLISNIYIYRKVIPVVITTLFQAVIIMAFSTIVAIPFTMHFDMISSIIKIAGSHSALWQLAIIWGLPVSVAVLFFIATSIEDKKEKENSIDMFMLIISVCAIGLVIGPEIVYVDDICAAEWARANTMFKLVFQAYILFGLCLGYMLPRLICLTKNKAVRIISIVPLIAFLLTVDYYRTTTDYCFGGVLGNEYKTLNASGYMFDQYIDTTAEVSMLDDKAAIQWLNKNVRKYPTVILEADGASYTFYERISVFTGQPTVLGWATHEWLWRAEDSDGTDYPEPQKERREDVKKLYTSDDPAEVKELIKKYNISYIVVGYNETCDSQTEIWGKECNTELLKSLGTVVFTSDYNTKWPLYIIDVRS